MMLTLEKLCSAEGFSSIRDEWQTLHASLSPAVPFTSPLWNELWWKHCRKNSVLSKDELLLTVLRSEGGRLVGVAPMVRTHRPAVGPVRLREVQFFGADPNVTEIRGVVCDPKEQEHVIDQLCQFLHRSGLRWNWVRWQGIRSEGYAVPRRPDCSDAFLWTRQVPDYFVDLPATWAVFEKGLTSRVRKKLRACHRELDRDGHKFELKVDQTPQDVHSAMDTFYRLHKERIKVRSYDVFLKPGPRKFLSEYCTEMAKREQLRVFSIVIDGAVVATRIGFLFGEELYLYHSGNDVQWDRYSIMTVLLGEIFRYSIQAGLKRVNLSTGNDRSKTRWRPSEILYTDGVELPNGLWPLVAYSFYEFLRLRGNTQPLAQLKAYLTNSRSPDSGAFDLGAPRSCATD